MHINKKHRVLDNKFNTVENLAKQIYSSNQHNIDFDVIDPSSPTKRVEKTIFEQIVQKVMPKKTVMWVNVYDIRHKDAILDFKRQARAARAVSPLEVDLRQRAISPQPHITLMGFSKDAFFDKRQGILKPCLKLKKVNIFTDLNKTEFASNRRTAALTRMTEATSKRNTMMPASPNCSQLQQPWSRFKLNEVTASSKQSKHFIINDWVNPNVVDKLPLAVFALIIIIIACLL